MAGFTNPRKEHDKYVQKYLDEEISRVTEESVFKALKNQEVTPLDAINLDDTEYDFIIDSETIEDPDIESFTYHQAVKDIIESTFYTEVSMDVEQGLIDINTESGDVCRAWIPWLEESSTGTVIAQTENPWSGTTALTKYAGETEKSIGRADPELLELIYVTAREAVPTAPIKVRDWHPHTFKEKANKIEQNNYLTELESNKTVEITGKEYLGKRRGNDALNEVSNFVKMARDARIIDYFVNIDYSNDRLNMVNGGYKLLTQNPEDYDIKTCIDDRIADKWRT